MLPVSRATAPCALRQASGAGGASTGFCLYPPSAPALEPRGCGVSTSQMLCSSLGCQGCYHSPSPCLVAPSAAAASLARPRARQHRRAAVVGAGRQDSARVGVQEGQDLLAGLLGSDAFDDLDLEYSTSSSVQQNLARSLGEERPFPREHRPVSPQGEQQRVGHIHNRTQVFRSNAEHSNSMGRQHEPHAIQRKQHQQAGGRARHRPAAHTNSDSSQTSSNLSPGSFYNTAGRRKGQHRLDDPQITAMIMRCRSLESLDAVCQQHGHRFNHLHVACAFNRLAKTPDALVEAHASVTHSLLTSLEQQFVDYLPWYTAREVANVIWSWGKLGHFPTAPAWQAVSAVITSDGGSLLYSPAATPQALSNLAWGLCQIRCKEEGVWDVVQKAVKAALASARSSHQAGAPAGPAFAALDIASTAWSLATVGRYNLLLFHDLCTTAMGQLHEFCPQDVSNLLWACATVQHPYKPLYEAAVPVILATLPGFSPQALANTMWAYVTAGVYHPGLFQAIARSATSCAHLLEPGHLCQLAWAMGKAQVHHPEFMQVAMLRAQAQPGAFKTRELARLLWAAATLKLGEKEAFDSIASHILSRMLASNGMQPDQPGASGSQPAAAHVSNEVSSSDGSGDAAADPHSSNPAAAADAPPRLVPAAAFNPQDVANIVWAYTACGFHSPKVLRMATQLCLANSAAFLAVPQSVQGIMWCYGYVGHYDPQLCELVASHLAQRTHHHRMTPYQLAGTLLPLAQLQHAGSTKDACKAAAADLTNALQFGNTSGPAGSGNDAGGFGSSNGWEFPSHDVVAKVLWSMALLRYFDAKFVSTAFRRLGAQWVQRVQVEERARERQRWSTASDHHAASWRSSQSWGTTLPEVPLPAAEEEAHQQQQQPGSEAGLHQQGSHLHHQQQLHSSSQGVGLHVKGGLLPKQLAQYFHVYLWLQDLGSPPALKAASCLPPDLVSEARAVWQHQVQSTRSVSDFQDELHKVLHSMGLEPSMERLTSDLLFSVDMVVHLGGQRVAVEANGPVHYTSSEPRRLLGNKGLRDWFLQKRGYKVLNIPWWSWVGVAGDQPRARAFVRQQLVALLGPKVVGELDAKEKAGSS